MPASTRSLGVTDRYRQQVITLRGHAVTVAKQNWFRLMHADDLDGSHAAWVAATAPALTVFQRTAAQLSAAYLAAYGLSETGDHTAILAVPERAGVARDGKPLAEALVPSVFTVKRAIGDGKPVDQALREGLDRAARMVGEEAVSSARDALSEGIRADDRIIGWRRVTSGGCGACMAAATDDVMEDFEPLDTHPWCECSTEPVFADVPDTVSRPTGEELFDRMPEEQQDAALGPDTAKLVRSGGVAFRDLLQRDPMVAIPDGITQAPLSALTHDS